MSDERATVIDEHAGVDAAELFRTIVEQVHESIIFSDPQGTIRLWNDGSEALFGFTRQEALGANLDLIIPEHLRRAHWKGFDAAMERGRTRLNGKAILTRALHKDGEKRYVEMSFGVLLSAAGVVLGAIAVARDGTERHRMQQEARQRAQPASGDTPSDAKPADGKPHEDRGPQAQHEAERRP